MSHDRGCFKCNEDAPHDRCNRHDCPYNRTRRFAVEPGGDKSDAPPRPEHFTNELPGYDSPQPPERITRIITVNEPGYDVVLFFNEDGGAEAVITRPDDKEPTNVHIAPPDPGRRIVVQRSGTNKFEVVYRDKPL